MAVPIDEVKFQIQAEALPTKPPQPWYALIIFIPVAIALALGLKKKR